MADIATIYFEQPGEIAYMQIPLDEEAALRSMIEEELAAGRRIEDADGVHVHFVFRITSDKARLLASCLDAAVEEFLATHPDAIHQVYKAFPSS